MDQIKQQITNKPYLMHPKNCQVQFHLLKLSVFRVSIEQWLDCTRINGKCPLETEKKSDSNEHIP